MGVHANELRAIILKIISHLPQREDLDGLQGVLHGVPLQGQ